MRSRSEAGHLRSPSGQRLQTVAAYVLMALVLSQTLSNSGTLAFRESVLTAWEEHPFSFCPDQPACMGLYNETCTCPPKEQVNQEQCYFQLKKPCGRSYCEPLCTTKTWKVSLEVTASAPPALAEELQSNEVQEAVAAIVKAKGCIDTFTCCTRRQMWNFVEGKQGLPLRSCGANGRMCNACKQAVKIKAEILDCPDIDKPQFSSEHPTFLEENDRLGPSFQGPARKLFHDARDSQASRWKHLLSHVAGAGDDSTLSRLKHGADEVDRMLEYLRHHTAATRQGLSEPQTGPHRFARSRAAAPFDVNMTDHLNLWDRCQKMKNKIKPLLPSIESAFNSGSTHICGCLGCCPTNECPYRTFITNSGETENNPIETQWYDPCDCKPEITEHEEKLLLTRRFKNSGFAYFTPPPWRRPGTDSLRDVRSMRQFEPYRFWLKREPKELRCRGYSSFLPSRFRETPWASSRHRRYSQHRSRGATSVRIEDEDVSETFEVPMIRFKRVSREEMHLIATGKRKAEAGVSYKILMGGAQHEAIACQALQQIDWAKVGHPELGTLFARLFQTTDCDSYWANIGMTSAAVDWATTGARWNDAPCPRTNEGFSDRHVAACYGDLATITVHSMIAKLIEWSHESAGAYWHSMTNRKVRCNRHPVQKDIVNTIINQAVIWLAEANQQDELSPQCSLDLKRLLWNFGRVCHMIADSYSCAHTVRAVTPDTLPILYFQDYDSQDSGLHGDATHDNVPWASASSLGLRRATTVSANIAQIFLKAAITKWSGEPYSSATSLSGSFSCAKDELTEYLLKEVYPFATEDHGNYSGLGCITKRTTTTPAKADCPKAPPYSGQVCPDAVIAISAEEMDVNPTFNEDTVNEPWDTKQPS